MCVSRVIILTILIILSSFTVSTADTPINYNEHPEFIPLTHTPCYIGCDYSFPYCYNYNISNMNDAMVVEEWNVDNDWVRGRVKVDINAIFLLKLCYQLSLNSREYQIHEGLNLGAEFEFKVRIDQDSSEAGINDQCIDEGKSSISYSSFDLRGDLAEDPSFANIKIALIEEMKFIIKHSVCITVYDSIAGNSLPENERRESMYCKSSQTSLVLSTHPCECD